MLPGEGSLGEKAAWSKNRDLVVILTVRTDSAGGDRLCSKVSIRQERHIIIPWNKEFGGRES